MGKILSIINQKGGVGKTTICYHLSHALNLMKKKVLLIDFDPQMNLTSFFRDNDYDVNTEMDCPSIFQLLINSQKELKALHSPLVISDILLSKRGVDLLPASSSLSGFDLTVSNLNFPRQLILKKFIELYNLRQEYDYIIIDAPPTLGLLVLNILCCVDFVLLPFKADQFSINGINQFYSILENIEEMGIVKTPYVKYLIPSILDLRRKKEKDYVEKLKLSNSTKLFDNFISSALILKAQDEKKSVFDYKSNQFKKYREYFIKLAKGVM